MRTNNKSIIRNAILGNIQYSKRVIVTLANGRTIVLTDDDFIGNGVKTEESISPRSSFAIGNASIGKMSVEIIDYEKKYQDIDFDGARVSYVLACEGYDDIIEMFDGNVVVSPTEKSSIIHLECYDDMQAFDADYVTELAFPTTAKLIVEEMCERYLGSKTVLAHDFDNSDYVIDKLPRMEGLTARQVLSWIAQITGNYARARIGKIVLGWYDHVTTEAILDSDGNVILDSSNSPITISTGTRFDNRKSITVGRKDTVITGVSVEEYDDGSVDEDGESVPTNTYMVGQEGYVIRIKDNEFITAGKGEAVANMLYERVRGLRFRTFVASIISNPILEPGDRVKFQDADDEEYESYVTNVTLQMGGNCNLCCGAESQSEVKRVQYTKQQAEAKKVKESVKETTAIAIESGKTATDAIEFEERTEGEEEKVGITIGDRRDGEFSGVRAVFGTEGLDIRNDEDESIAYYGESSRIGKEDGARFETKSTSLSAYDDDGNEYFNINKDGGRVGAMDMLSVSRGEEKSQMKIIAMHTEDADKPRIGVAQSGMYMFPPNVDGGYSAYPFVFRPLDVVSVKVFTNRNVGANKKIYSNGVDLVLPQRPDSALNLKPLAVVGYRITGTGRAKCNVFNIRIIDGNKLQYSIQNMSSTAARITLEVTLLLTYFPDNSSDDYIILPDEGDIETDDDDETTE